MKREACAVLAAVLLLTLAACGCTDDGAIDDQVFPVAYEEYIVQITDPHITLQSNRERLDEVVSYINGLDPAPLCVVVTGDLVHYGGGLGGPLFYNVTVKVLDNMTVPYYVIPGNHDYRAGAIPGEDNSIANYIHAFPRFSTFPYYAKYDLSTGEQVKIIGLDTGPDSTVSAILEPTGEGISDVQYDALVDELAKNDTEFTYILTHHPAIQPNGDMSQVFLENRAEFMQTCQFFGVDGVISGHTHKYSLTNANGTTWGGLGTFYLTTPDITQDICVSLIPVGGGPELSTIPGGSLRIAGELQNLHVYNPNEYTYLVTSDAHPSFSSSSDYAVYEVPDGNYTIQYEENTESFTIGGSDYLLDISGGEGDIDWIAPPALTGENIVTIIVVAVGGVLTVAMISAYNKRQKRKMKKG